MSNIVEFDTVAPHLEKYNKEEIEVLELVKKDKVLGAFIQQGEDTVYISKERLGEVIASLQGVLEDAEVVTNT